MLLEENASKLFMCRAILENIIPAFISFLIGPWSDKFGRKPVLLSTTFGKKTNLVFALDDVCRAPSNPSIFFHTHTHTHTNRIFFGVFYSNNRISAIVENASQPMVLSVGFYTAVVAWRNVWPDNWHLLLHQRRIKP